jgi:hypothetical protein
MRPSVVSAAAICGVAAIMFVATPADRRNREDPSLQRSEVARLRAHFDSVLSELNLRGVSHLRATQRSARAQLVRALARYRDAGVFPHNHDFLGERVPYFRDEHGTLCAMAYLVASTGRDDLVDEIARARNNAYIPDLGEDPRLVAWLDSVGLTVAEAARIQPEYNGRRVAVPWEAGPYLFPSLALGVPAFVTTVLNWRAPREKRPDAPFFIGAVTGAGAALLGGAILAQERDGSARAVGVADLTVGAAALAAVVRRSLRRTPATPPRPPIASAGSRFSLDVTPASQAGRLRPAARVRIRF